MLAILHMASPYVAAVLAVLAVQIWWDSMIVWSDIEHRSCECRLARLAGDVAILIDRHDSE